MLLLSDILGTDPNDVFYDAEKSEETEALARCANKLPERERQIIKMRFGILGIEKKTQKEIADIMGISQSYISRLEKKVLSKLKKEMAKMVWFKLRGIISTQFYFSNNLTILQKQKNYLYSFAKFWHNNIRKILPIIL